MTAKYTALSFVPLMFWSTIPIVSIIVSGASNYLSLGVSYLCSFLLFAIYWNIKYRGSVLSNIKKQSIQYLMVNFIGTLPAHITFYYAIQLGNPMHCYIIINSWPIFALFLSCIVFKKQISKYDIMASCMGIIGIIVLTFGEGIAGDHKKSLLGILLSFANFIIWSFFSVYIKRYQKTSADFAGLSFGIAAFFAFILWVLLDDASLQNIEMHQYFAMIYFGLFPCGVSYLIYNIVMKHGNQNTVILLGYTVPILGSLLMYIFGYAQFTTSTIAALAFIIAGSCIAILRPANNKS